MRWWSVGRWALPGAVAVVAWWSTLPGLGAGAGRGRTSKGLLEEVGP